MWWEKKIKEKKMSNLVEMFYEITETFSKKETIIFGAKKVTYGKIREISLRFSHALYHLGVRKEDKVCLWLPNCPEFIYSYFAILSLGAIVVPINNLFKREEAKFIIEDSKCTILILSIDKLEASKVILSRVSSLKYLICVPRSNDASVKNFYELLKEDGPFFKNKLKPDDIAEIIYTSGTTGRPKGACLTHRNLISNIRDCSYAIRVTQKDSFLCILPLFHSFASTVCMLLPFYKGAKIVLMRAIRPFKRVLRAVFKNRVTVFVAVPSVYNILSQIRIPWYKHIGIILFNPVRVYISGAAALSRDVLKQFEKKFKRPLLEGYGLTEASPVVSLNPLKKRKPSSVGIPLDSLSVKIVNNEGKSLSKGVGELLVKGPSIMKGYYRLGKETENVLRGGWLYTGDLASIDREGYIYIKGRKKEMINVRGLNVYPREIEELIYKHPDVKEVACVGISHPHRGEVPVVFVVGENIDTRELIKYLRANLASYKVPLKVIVKDSLPKNATGKILKKDLKKEIEFLFLKKE